MQCSPSVLFSTVLAGTILAQQIGTNSLYHFPVMFCLLLSFCENIINHQALTCVTITFQIQEVTIHDIPVSTKLGE